MRRDPSTSSAVGLWNFGTFRPVCQQLRRTGDLESVINERSVQGHLGTCVCMSAYHWQSSDLCAVCMRDGTGKALLSLLICLAGSECTVHVPWEHMLSLATGWILGHGAAVSLICSATGFSCLGQTSKWVIIEKWSVGSSGVGDKMQLYFSWNFTCLQINTSC